MVLLSSQVLYGRNVISVEEAVERASHIYVNDGMNQCSPVLLTRKKLHRETKSPRTAEHSETSR